jgi:hypothetical protein
MGYEQNAPTDRLLQDIANLRDRMLKVHYYEESHWLAAAVSFPHLCASPRAREVLRSAATIAWQFGFPAVSLWLNSTIQPDLQPESQDSQSAGEPDALPAAPDWA